MSVPIKDSIKINFANGLDTKSDPFQVQAENFLALNNSLFTTGGSLTKRNGFAGGFTTTVNSPNPALTYSNVPGTLSTARKVFSYNNELLLNDAWNLYSWDAANSAWNYKSRSTMVDLSTSPAMCNSNSFTNADTSTDSTSSIKVFCGFNNNKQSTFYSIQDVITGQFIVNQAQFGAAGVIYKNPRCISIAGKSWIFAVNSTDHNLYYQAIVGQTVSGSVTSWITNLNNTFPTYDVDVDPNTGNIYISYLDSSGSPKVTISAISSSLVVGNTQSVVTTATNGVSWFGDGTNIWIVYATSAAVSSFAVNNAVSAITGTAAVIDNTSRASTVNNVTGVWSSTQNSAFFFYDPITTTSGLTSAAAINYNTATIVAGAVTPLTGAQFCGSVTLNSKAFSVSGIPHVCALYNYFSLIQTTFNGAYATSNQVIQATIFLLNLYNTNANMNGSNNPPVANIAGKIAADQSGILATTSGILSGVHQNTAGIWELAIVQNTNFGITTPTASTIGTTPQGVFDCQFNFNLTNPDVQVLGNNALIAGAQVSMYDGANVVEQNFHIYPNSGTATVGAGGHLGLAGANSTYSYIYTYEWIDNEGQVHRSFPSPVITPLTGGQNYTFASGNTTGGVALTVPNLRITTKQKVVINIYRTLANGSVYYLIGNWGTLVNDPSTDTQSYTDNTTAAADANIVGNIQLYTTGGLGYYAPPATSVLTNFKNRAIQVPSENKFQIGYSNAILQNFPVQFVPNFLQNIGTVGGPLVTIAQMDDKMIIFKNGKVSGPSIYYMAGQGPAPSGANNDFQDPLPIAVDIGCVDRPSVVLTPIGLIFKSNKGLYLLDRSLQASYIGAPVAAYDQFSVLSSQLIPNATQVRFWLSNGTLLMYDYFYKQWSTWTPPAGVSDCIYQGQHTYVSSSGQVYQETPGTFVDGTNTAVLMSFTTSWIKLAGLQGYQRSYFLFLLGQFISSHKLSVSLYTDFSTVADSTVTITPDSTQTLETWRIFFAKQRCESFQIKLSEVSTGVLGQGLTLSGLNLIVGAKNRFKTITAAQSIG